MYGHGRGFLEKEWSFCMFVVRNPSKICQYNHSCLLSEGFSIILCYSTFGI